MSSTEITEVLSVLRELKQSSDFFGLHIASWNLLADGAARRAMESFMRQLLKEPRYAYSKRLEHYAYKVFSDGGEDGMLQEIFNRIGATNRRFVEFGVSGGNTCNTHFLLYLGWSGLWMEMDERCVKFVQGTFGTAIANGLLTVQQAVVTRENVNALMADAGFIGEIDLLSIDIDGNDYHVCEAISAISPRVIVIEYNASFPPPTEYILPYVPTAVSDGCCFGGSLTSMNIMLSRKGYVLVATDVSGANAFFVRRDLVTDHFVQTGDVKALYNPPRYGINIGYPEGHHAPRCWTPSFRLKADETAISQAGPG